MVEPSPVTLRPASVDDVEALAALWHRGWIDGHAGHVPRELHAHRTLDDFRKRVPAKLPATTVAELAGKIAGFVTLHDDELEQLYVDGSARGAGVAGVLLRHGERLIAERFPVAWLAVAVGNARARRFYAREGWTDAAALEYPAEVPDGPRIVVPCRRYEKPVR